MSASERLQRKIDRIVRQNSNRTEDIDSAVNDELTMDEVLTLGLMPINSKLRTFVTGCLLRDTQRKKEMDALKKDVKENDLVPVEVHGGGKCKITIFMTREAAARERSG